MKVYCQPFDGAMVVEPQASHGIPLEEFGQWSPITIVERVIQRGFGPDHVATTIVNNERLTVVVEFPINHPIRSNTWWWGADAPVFAHIMGG